MKSVMKSAVNLNKICIIWNPPEGFIKYSRISHDFIKSNTILLKATGFHEIQSFQKILLNPLNPTGFHWNQQYFMKFTDIIGFHVIQQISITDFTRFSLRISLWISFADFILDFMWNPPKTVRHLTSISCFYWFLMDFTWISHFMWNLHEICLISWRKSTYQVW